MNHNRHNDFYNMDLNYNGFLSPKKFDLFLIEEKTKTCTLQRPASFTASGYSIGLSLPKSG